MGTKSNIAIERTDGAVEVIQCQYDGYPGYNGAMLLRHYNTPDKVKELIDLGNISYLAENPAPTGPLWKRGRILGTRISGKYPVVENTGEYVTIGCHRFARETVESIYRRYAGRTEHEMQRQEPALRQSCADRIAQLVSQALEELRPIVRQQPWYRDLHAKAKLLKPA